MCRWLAYSGDPILLRELILRPRRSLIVQSLTARTARTTTNGDGFGVGWYDEAGSPGLYKHVLPAWSDPNLRDLCEHVRSSRFLAHVRAATRMGTQYTNCHPFRHGRWLFVHNGQIRDFSRVRRDLLLGIAPEIFDGIEGTTDSEVLFHLALDQGLEDDPQGALERMAGLVEEVCVARDVHDALEMTLGLSDGQRVYAVRYSSNGSSNTLYFSKRVAALREIVPPEHAEQLSVFSPGARAIVSEPLTDLSEIWDEVEESSFVVLEDGEVTCRPFEPQRKRAVPRESGTTP